MRPPAAIVFKIAGFSFTALALACVIFALVGTRKGILYFAYGKYMAYLTSRMRSLHIFKSPARIVVGQIAALFALSTVAALARLPYFSIFAAVIAVAPAVWLERELKNRVTKLDFQADGFATALANALKSTPSIAAALENVAGMMEGPVAQEFSLAIKEMRLGKSLDEALTAVGPRAKSPKLATVLASILIGRQVGGNLTKVLETTAATLREMERLEGVVRQKTAESRAQMWAMTLAPFVLCYGMMQLQENFFDPLTTTTTGYIICACAAASYISALVAARKILAVDI